MTPWSKEVLGDLKHPVMPCTVAENVEQSQYHWYVYIWIKYARDTVKRLNCRNILFRGVGTWVLLGEIFVLATSVQSSMTLKPRSGQSGSSKKDTPPSSFQWPLEWAQALWRNEVFLTVVGRLIGKILRSQKLHEVRKWENVSWCIRSYMMCWRQQRQVQELHPPLDYPVSTRKHAKICNSAKK